MTQHSNQLMRGTIHRLLPMVTLFVCPIAPRYPPCTSTLSSFPTLQARIAPSAVIAQAQEGSTSWQPAPRNPIQNP
jgi:hypothetical protein